MTVGAIATITDPRNFYAGAKVRVLSVSDWAGVIVCKVELVRCPGLTMHLSVTKMEAAQ